MFEPPQLPSPPPPIHPSQFEQYLSNGWRAGLASWGLLTLSCGLLTLGTLSSETPMKLGGFGGGLLSALVARPIRKIGIANEKVYADVADVSLSQFQNWLYQAMRPAAEGMTIEIEAGAPLLPLFDWRGLADSDEHPVICIVAPMGGGKSMLAKYLANYILFAGETPEISVFDIYARRRDWEGCEAIFEHEQMLERMSTDFTLIKERIEQYRQGTGKPSFPAMFRVVEEAPDTFRSIRKLGKPAEATLDQWLAKFSTVTRKIKGRLCLISVKMLASELGAGSETRDDATTIFVGWKGVSKAMKDIRIYGLGLSGNESLRAQLSASLAGVRRPALVYTQGEWYPAAIPELTEQGDPISYRSEPTLQAETTIAQLNRILNETPDEPIDVTAEAIPSELYDGEGDLLPLPALILDYAQGQPEGITASKCKQSKNALKRVPTSEIEHLFVLLASERLGVIGAVGDSLRFQAKD